MTSNTNEKQDKTLFLSFFGDGPYWSDFLHILAYPSNINYIWPFRYDGSLIEPSLIEFLIAKKILKV